MSVLRAALAGLRARMLEGHVVLLPSPWEDGKRRPHLILDTDGQDALVLPITHSRPGTVPGDVPILPAEKPHLGLDDRPPHHGRPCAFRTVWRRVLPLEEISRLAGTAMTPASGIPEPLRQRLRGACATVEAAAPTAGEASLPPSARRPDAEKS